MLQSGIDINVWAVQGKDQFCETPAEVTSYVTNLTYSFVGLCEKLLVKKVLTSCFTCLACSSHLCCNQEWTLVCGVCRAKTSLPTNHKKTNLHDYEPPVGGVTYHLYLSSQTRWYSKLLQKSQTMQAISKI